MISAAYLEKWKRQRIISILKNSSPKRFETLGEKSLLPAFRSAIASSPAYMDILTKHAVAYGTIKTKADFSKKLPLLNKDNYFIPYTLEQLAGKNLARIKLAMTTSGFTGKFAYGFSSGKAVRQFRMGVDTSFDYCFDISNRKTFLINCAPMGVHIETSLPIAETSVRSDMVIALLKKVSPWYEQTIIIGDPYFMKKLIEEGDQEKIAWRKLNVSLVSGQDWLPESLRTYLANRLEMDPETDLHRSIITTMGMTELGINVFHESAHLIRLRREAARNASLKNSLSASEMKAPPMFFHYYPFRTHIESLSIENRSELIFTSLDKDGIIPVIRYATGDCGTVMSYNQLKKKLGPDHSRLIPDLKLPVGIIEGRAKSRYSLGEHTIFLEDLKESLYVNPEVAASITGLIKFEPNTTSPILRVHLKPGLKETPTLRKQIENSLAGYCPITIQLKIENYTSFPNALELSYEHKLSL